MTKMFLHILKNRKKMAASRPASETMSGSDVFHKGPSQAKTPLPSGGGACFSSACFSLGA